MNINGESSDSNTISWRNLNPAPICHCGKKIKVTKSWTKENPGRRFLRCEIHGFCRWVDEENPSGWQKSMLLEARDEILNLKETIRYLKNGGDVGSSSKVVSDHENEIKKLHTKFETQVMKLEKEILVGKEREKLLSQFVVLSWGGFIAVTAMIIVMLK